MDAAMRSGLSIKVVILVGAALAAATAVFLGLLHAGAEKSLERLLRLRAEGWSLAAARLVQAEGPAHPDLPAHLARLLARARDSEPEIADIILFTRPQGIILAAADPQRRGLTVPEDWLRNPAPWDRDSAEGRLIARPLPLTDGKPAESADTATLVLRYGHQAVAGRLAELDHQALALALPLLAVSLLAALALGGPGLAPLRRRLAALQAGLDDPRHSPADALAPRQKLERAAAQLDRLDRRKAGRQGPHRRSRR